jgi:hypothetical protein
MHREAHVRETADRVRIGRAGDPHAAVDRRADELGAQVDPIRQAVRLQGRARLDAGREDGVEVDRVRRPVVDDPALRMADRSHSGMMDGREGAVCQFFSRASLPGVHRRLYPVE